MAWEAPFTPRAAQAEPNSRSMGAADGAIMPTIMTAHMAKVKKTSAGFQGWSMVMPMAAIALSYSMPADICRSRYTRYAQAKTVLSPIQAQMRPRSREGRAAADGELSTLPGERRVLPVVPAGGFIPIHAERMHVALRCAGKRIAIDSGVACIGELHRRGGVRVESFRAFG